jgi:TPP-dependent pyruvate/acetoin dehydrogenase alpha subunit
VRAVNAAATQLIEAARAGDGPSFLLCNTYRYTGHHVGDINREYYRSKQEEQEWKATRDPIKLHGDWLILERLADEASLHAIESEVRAEMKAAVEFAVGAPYPGGDEVGMHVYAGD